MLLPLQEFIQFDVVKTRIQVSSKETCNYSSLGITWTIKIIKESGIIGLYSGFVPIWARFAPATCLQLVIFEQIKPIFGVEKMGE